MNDNKYTDAAVTSNADFLITHDKDFNVLGSVDFPKIRRSSLREFYQLFFGAEMPE